LADRDVVAFLQATMALHGLEGTRSFLAQASPLLTVLDVEESNSTCNTTDPCAESAATEEYDTPMHIGALFIIMVVSAVGTVLPLVMARFRTARIPEVFLRAGRSFGTGVILATAFIHMFVPAVQALTSECLSTEFNETYTAFAGLFAMLAALLVQAVEFISTHVLERVFSTKDQPPTGSEPLPASDTVDTRTMDITDIEAGPDEGDKQVVSVPVGVLNPDTVVHAHTHMHAHEDHEHCSHPHPGMATGYCFALCSVARELVANRRTHMQQSVQHRCAAVPPPADWRHCVGAWHRLPFRHYRHWYDYLSVLFRFMHD
jgi:hypothetical protein